MNKTITLLKVNRRVSLFSRWHLRVFFTLLAISFFTCRVAAQHNLVKHWDKTLGGGADDYFSASVATPDGGYLLGGTSFSAKSHDKSDENRGESHCVNGSCYYSSEDFWLVKIDANGQKSWDKTLGGRGSDQLKAMVAVPEGGYLLAGISYSNTSGDKSADSKGYSDYWLVRIDLYGNKIWDQTFGGSSADDLSALLPTSDGGYLLGGTSFSGRDSDKTDVNRGENTSDYWIIKIDKNGAKEWDKTYGGSNTDYLTFLTATPDNHYLLGGSSNSRVSGDKTAANKQSATARAENTYNGWLVKIDHRGHKIWDKTYGFSDRDNHITAISFDPGTDGFLLGGSTAGLTFNDYDYNYLVAHINANGDQNWLSTYGGESNDFLSTIIAAPDGTFMVGGTSSSRAGNDKSENNKGYEDFWLLRLAGRRKVWDKTLGSHDSDFLRTLLPTADGGYLLGGSSNSSRAADKSENLRGGRDYWVLKLRTNLPPTASITDFRYGGTRQDNFTQLLKTGDNGYLLSGYSASNNNGDKSEPSRGGLDYWVIKTDATGKEMWNKRFGGFKNDYLNSVVQTADGGYLLGGSSESGVGGDKTGVSRGDRDFWVVKISSTGTKEWDRTFGGSGFEDLRQLRQLPSGNYILAGYSISPAGDDKSENSRGGYDYWVVLLNARGNQLADYCYGGNANDYLQDVVVNTDGSLLLGGTSASGASGDKSQVSQGGSDYWIIKINVDGYLFWDKSYGGSEQDNLHALATTGDHYILAGHSASPASGDKSQTSRGGSDFWVVKINNTGQKLWDNTYGGEHNEELRSLAVTTNGSLLLGGTSLSGKSSDKTQPSQGSSDYWIVQTNNDGTKQWDRRYGGNRKDELRTLLQDGDGSYLLGGRSSSETSGDRTQFNQGGSDYWVLKVPHSVITTPHYLAADLVPVTERATSYNPRTFGAYPNPFRNKITITFTLPQTQAATIKIYDLQGREVAALFQGEVQANKIYQIEWQAKQEAAGMYLLQLQTPLQYQQQKLLLTK